MNAPTQNLQDFKDFLDCLPWAITFSRLTDGDDSIVWQHDWTWALVKQFNHRLTQLTAQDLQVYHAIHARFANIPVEIPVSDTLWLRLNGKQIKQIRVQVLDLWDHIMGDGTLLVTEIPHIVWSNLADIWSSFTTEFRHPKTWDLIPGWIIIDKYIHDCLRCMDLPIMEFWPKHDKYKPWYNITRDNIMIEWLTDWVLSVYITDIGADISETLRIPILPPL